MRAGELPASWSSGELHQLARFLTEFGRNDIITFLGPLVRSPTLDNLVTLNSARPLSFLRQLLIEIASGFGIFGIRISMAGPVMASRFSRHNWIGRLRRLRERLIRMARHRGLMTSKLKLNETQFANRCNLECGPAQRCGPVHGRRLKRRLLNWYRIVGANSQSRRHRHMVSDRLRLQCDRSKSALFSLRKKVAFCGKKL
jgi:hypothetical protein